MRGFLLDSLCSQYAFLYINYPQEDHAGLRQTQETPEQRRSRCVTPPIPHRWCNRRNMATFMPAAAHTHGRPCHNGDWLITILLTSIPIVNIVMLFVWRLAVIPRRAR
jgi:hypothetical protein